MCDGGPQMPLTIPRGPVRRGLDLINASIKARPNAFAEFLRSTCAGLPSRLLSRGLDLRSARDEVISNYTAIGCVAALPALGSCYGRWFRVASPRQPCSTSTRVRASLGHSSFQHPQAHRRELKHSSSVSESSKGRWAVGESVDHVTRRLHGGHYNCGTPVHCDRRNAYLPKKSSWEAWKA